MQWSGELVFPLSPSAPKWTLTCSQFPRWQAITAFDVITEMLLFGLSLYILRGVKMKFTNTLIVVFAFALRLPSVIRSAVHVIVKLLTGFPSIIIPAIFRLHWLKIQYSSLDQSLDGVLASVFTQIQLSFAIFATTTPILRTFMEALNTHYGGPNGFRIPKYNSNQSGKIPAVSISIGSPTKSRNRTEQEPASKWAVPQTRWDDIGYNVQVTASDKESRSLKTKDGRQESISKNTSWAVDHCCPQASGARKAL